MPGTFAVDAAATFKNAVLVNSGPKPKFGGSPGEQETNAAGVRKWIVQVAVTFTPTTPGLPEISELIAVTITDHANPGEGLAPGTAIVLDGLRVGINPPERTDKGGIKGGKLWYTATGLRSASAASITSRRSESAA